LVEQEELEVSQLAEELLVTLHMAAMDARQKHHEIITVEHLLLAMLDNPSASEVLRACAANIEELRKLLTDFINEHTPTVTGDEVDTQPTLGFQRVIQRASLHARSSGKKELTGADVLEAISDEKDSQAVYFLHQEGCNAPGRGQLHLPRAADRAFQAAGERVRGIPVGLDKAIGIVSLVSVKDPTDPQWADDAAIKESSSLGCTSTIQRAQRRYL
jgi:hypothetical protein